MIKEFATNNQALLHDVDTNTTPLLVLTAIGIACYYIWKAYKSYRNSKDE